MSIKTLAARMEYLGGNQIGRINQQKLRSLRWALKNSYNSRMIKTPLHAAWPCLINTNNLKADYDKEYISVEFDSGLEAGDTFECLDDGTHWMVYLPVITETAYLQSEIIRCRYTLEVNEKEYWIYFQGPTETDLRWFQKNQINVNELNLSGTIYIKNDENTKKYFKRFTRVKLDGHEWEVQVTDSITVPGIIELEVQEYYDNTIEELPKIRQHSEVEIDPKPTIIGETLVKPDTIVGYMIDAEYYSPDNEWSVTDNPRVRIENIKDNGRICEVRIYAGTVKPFTLQYGDQLLKVNVDWEKPIIQGPQVVYPYDTHTYWLKNKKGEFSINSNLAKIIEFNEDSCKVEIVTGKKGKFVLDCLLEDGTTTSLEIDIKSL
jgi:hypothetical protein